MLALAAEVQGSRRPARTGAGPALGRIIPRGWMRATSALTSALLVVYGALNGLAAALVLSGVLHAAGRADSAALRWHAGAWHLWFLV